MHRAAAVCSLASWWPLRLLLSGPPYGHLPWCFCWRVSSCQLLLSRSFSSPSQISNVFVKGQYVSWPSPSLYVPLFTSCIPNFPVILLLVCSGEISACWSHRGVGGRGQVRAWYATAVSFCVLSCVPSHHLKGVKWVISFSCERNKRCMASY